MSTVSTSALPLRWRLSIITAATTLIALVVTSAAVLALVRTSLVSQIDDQLRTAISALSDEYGRGAAGGPSDYHTEFISADGSVQIVERATTSDGQIPALPTLTPHQADTLDGEGFTVTSAASDGPRWRVVARSASLLDGTVGVVMVAVPLSAAEATTAAMMRIMTMVGFAVVVLAALVGYYAVQKSLRPLRDIERVAGQVAAGDLRQRAPVEPASTEVGRLGLSFNAMVADLERAFALLRASEERMRRFVSDASHELRTPLASIRGYGELYRMGAVPEDEVGSTMARIEGEATRMGDLVTDLLSLARLDEGRGLQLGTFDLTAIAADGVADLGALDPTRPTQLITEGTVEITADGNRIRQVVTNLIGNAVQHTPRGTPVEVAVRTEQEWAVLEVRDHGPGIAPEDSARVFERFYRPDTSRTRTSGGSGLGLAIVATIVAAHGGTVRHEPTPGGGVTMVVRLPVAHP